MTANQSTLRLWVYIATTEVQHSHHIYDRLGREYYLVLSLGIRLSTTILYYNYQYQMKK